MYSVVEQRTNTRDTPPGGSHTVDKYEEKGDEVLQSVVTTDNILAYILPQKAKSINPMATFLISETEKT